jgi:16S rRNA (guanine966-N2)-methyltransferase
MTRRAAARNAPRIIAGRWKGRTLQVPRGARPTSSRAREALFDVLQGVIGDARVLDLYAGSGALGLEALSRGASRAVFVEKDSRALEANLAALGADPGEFDVVRKNVREAVATLMLRGDEFDLVFADPPYLAEAAVPERVAGLLAPSGTFILQTDSDAAPKPPRGLVAAERRAYGRNVFWLFEARKTA